MKIELSQEEREKDFDEEDYSLYSDLYKEDTGFRPRGHNFANRGEFYDWINWRQECMELEAMPNLTSWSESHSNNPFAILKEG